MPSSIPVEIYLEDEFFPFFEQEDNPLTLATCTHWFGSWLTQVADSLPQAKGYELSLRLTDDAAIKSLNTQYRHKNQPTDVLAFAALEIDVPKSNDELYLSEPLYLGDIIISGETAYRQAREQNHSLKTELAWLASHGLLHLLGWDHPDERSLLKMLAEQETLLNKVGLLN